MRRVNSESDASGDGSIHSEGGEVDPSSSWRAPRFIKLPKRGGENSFLPPVSVQRSAAQIDGAVSHLTGRLPPRCTQSHALVSRRRSNVTGTGERTRGGDLCIFMAQNSSFVLVCDKKPSLCHCDEWQVKISAFKNSELCLEPQKVSFVFCFWFLNEESPVKRQVSESM